MGERAEKGEAMTPLPESRLRGLAEALGWQYREGIVEINTESPDAIQWFDRERLKRTVKIEDWLQETWDGAGFILGEFKGWSLNRKRAFTNNLHSGAGFGGGKLVGDLLTECISNLTPARIAKAAADALGVPK